MKGMQTYLYSLVIGVAVGGIAYLAADNLILAGVVALAFFGAFAFLFFPSIAKYRRRERIRHECYQFVNAFLITLSVSQSVEHSFLVAKGDIQGEFTEWTKKDDSLSIVDKVAYLKRYFQMEIYDMFISILDLYLDRGGDVLALSSELLNELARIEETGRFLMAKSARNSVQFGFMWLIAVVVIVFVRFGLNTFFSSLKNSLVFLIGIGAFFAFFLISIFVYLNAYVGAFKKESHHG